MQYYKNVFGGMCPSIFFEDMASMFVFWLHIGLTGYCLYMYLNACTHSTLNDLVCHLILASSTLSALVLRLKCNITCLQENKNMYM